MIYFKGIVRYIFNIIYIITSESAGIYSTRHSTSRHHDSMTAEVKTLDVRF